MAKLQPNQLAIIFSWLAWLAGKVMWQPVARRKPPFVVAGRAAHALAARWNCPG
jgi:hypothetical protein